MRRRTSKAGFSLIELLCVMAIISILAAMLLGAVGRAYQRVRRFAGEMESPAHVEELRARLIRYVQEHPTFPELSLNDVIIRCGVSSKCAVYLRSSRVTYAPFSSADPDEKIVVLERFGQGRHETFQAYPKGWLCKPDPE